MYLPGTSDPICGSARILKKQEANKVAYGELKTCSKENKIYIPRAQVDYQGKGYLGYDIVMTPKPPPTKPQRHYREFKNVAMVPQSLIQSLHSRCRET